MPPTDDTATGVATARASRDAAPLCAEARRAYADALRRDGQHAAACAAYQEALSAHPRDAEAWFGLGQALTDLRQVDAAAQAFRRSLRLRPRNAAARVNLAVFHFLAGADAEATAELAKALRLAPQDPRALLLKARIALRAEAFGPAETACRAVLADAPDNAEALVLLGRILCDAGQVEAAVPPLEQAIAIAPDDAEAHNMLGIVRKALGAMGAARVSFRTAIALAPAMGDACLNIADVVNFADEPTLCAHIARMIAAPAPGDSGIAFHFAAGRMLEDQGDHPAALDRYIAGNRLKRATFTYDTAELAAFCAAIKAAFPAGFFATPHPVGDPSARPVFIVGMPRSGSTLIEQVLASHPAIHACGEVKAFPQALAAGRRRFPHLPAYPALAGALRQEQARAIAAAYHAALPPAARPGQRTTDKLPGNAFHVGLIHLLFPQARIIWTERDPMATCVSIFRTLFTEHVPFAYDFAELAAHHHHLRDLQAHWLDVLPAGTITRIAYEDLVTDTEATVRRLLATLDLPWDDACLRFDRTPRAIRTASVAQVRQPIYTAALAGWRKFGRSLDPLAAALQSM